MEQAKGSTGGFQAAPDPAAGRKQEAARRRAGVIAEAAGRIRAMRSWLKSGVPCPWAKDPQGEIDDEVAKIKDHYGPTGVDELRQVVRELEAKKT